ncbi:MAG: PIG-L family deacetylase [Bdellovibrionales bacterium]|nr:PIG-L family deacetylase [Bdellovibrionales bacterium]
MKSKKSDLIIIAHPDDETLFFSSVIQQRPYQRPCEIICVTDGNADGMGSRRHRQFLNACRKLGVNKTHWWKYSDIYEKRLPLAPLVERLSTHPKPFRIFTHNILGEYGHPHHQDVSYAVHRAFFSQVPIFSTAYNTYPTLSFTLSREQYERKTEILSKIYASETKRFIHILPATYTEGFLQVSLAEVESIYAFYTRGKRLQQRHLNAFKWYWPYIKDGQLSHTTRSF